VARLAIGNPNLVMAISAAFAGALLRLFNLDGAGLHLFGDTSIGKTTGLEAGRSVWDGEAFHRGWRATANALEGAAMLHTDTVLVVDEIHIVDPRELDQAIYALINGYGKGRSERSGAPRPIARWHVFVLSSGEVSSEAHLSLGGLSLRAGQSLRLLDVPTEGKVGGFDDLHGYGGGAAFADAIR
jgi:putative DNA primase/helicase